MNCSKLLLLLLIKLQFMVRKCFFFFPPHGGCLTDVLRGHDDSVTSCHFCFHDTRLLTSSYDKTAIFWVFFLLSVMASLRVVTSSWDKNVNAWDLETGKILVNYSNPHAYSTPSFFNFFSHHTSTVMSCQFDAQSQHLASTSVDGSIKLWDLCSHKTTLTINSGHTNVISSCCFTHDSRYLCTASWDRTLQLWDVQTGSFRTRGGVQLCRGHEGSVSSCAFSSDGTTHVHASNAKYIHRIYIFGHLDWVTDVDISADKKWVVSSSKDSTVRLWNIEQCEHIPAVIETRRAQGMGLQTLKVQQCEECGKPFSVSRMENTNLITKCVFCRRKAPNRQLPAPPCASSNWMENRKNTPAVYSKRSL
uniref:WD repeat domain 88 n=1 Tax=Electrophorus electricus TaxID=8005 RepID=A0A4W4GIZ1_ELEEL